VRRHFALLALAGLALLTPSCGGGSDSEADSSESFTNATWGTVVSEPDDHEGAAAELVGRVFTVERDEDATYLQVWMDVENNEQNTVVVTPDPQFQVETEDYVRVSGTVGEPLEGENAFGAELTLPTVEADSVEVVDATAAAQPAHTTYPNQSSEQAGVRATVTKIEAAPNETRVFVRVNNQSAADFSFYAFSSKLVANGQAVKSEFGNYPEPASEVPANSETSGVILFKAIPPDASLRLILEGSSDNTDVGNFGQLAWNFTWE
jgi:hypothetical protein